MSAELNAITSKNRFVESLLGAATWIIGLLFFFPVFWLAINSVKQEKVANGDPTLRFTPTVDNYQTVTDSSGTSLNFWEAFGFSAMIVLASTLLVMVLAVPAAYALAIRPVEKWKKVLFFFISTKFLPVVAGIIPLYFLAEKSSLLNTPYVLIILYTGMNLPLAVWMMRSFFKDVPRELIEASQIDGANLLSQIRSVVLPIVAPGLAATALLCVIFAWNEYFLAVQLYTVDGGTIPYWVSTGVSNRGNFLAKLSAASTLATLPVVIAGWVAQKRMIRGLAMGAIK